MIVNLCKHKIAFIHPDYSVTMLHPHETPLRFWEKRVVKDDPTVQLADGREMPVRRVTGQRTLIFPDDLPCSTTAVIIENDLALWFSETDGILNAPVPFDVYRLHDYERTEDDVLISAELCLVLPSSKKKHSKVNNND